jgi:hypothetical protein
LREGIGENEFSRQQPSGDTPGVVAAPVAFAGVIVPGVARFIVVLSAHADVFGVGITTTVGSMLVVTSCVTSGWMVPGGGLAGICGVVSGKAAPLAGGPPGTELHTVVEGLPSGGLGEMFPVVVMPAGVAMVPNAAPGVIAVGDIVVVDDVIVAEVPGMDGETVLGTVDDVGTGIAVMEGGGRAGGPGGCGAGMVEPGKSDANDVAGCADSVRNGVAVLPVGDVEEVAGTADIAGGADIAVVPAIDDREVTGTAGVPGVICPAGVEQVTTVPGIVGSEASGSGANVVPGVPGWVVAENGLGPLSGEVTIVPGVDESAMAVVPMVETCARLALAPSSSVAIVNSKRCIAISPRLRRDEFRLKRVLFTSPRRGEVEAGAQRRLRVRGLSTHSDSWIDPSPGSSQSR